jgi:hypothetical protein
MEVWIGMLVGMPLQQGASRDAGGSGRPPAFDGIGEGCRGVRRRIARHAAGAQRDDGDRRTKRAHVDGSGPRPRVGARAGCADQYVAPGEPLPGLPPMVAAMAAQFETYETDIDMRCVSRSVYGVRLTPLDEFLRGMLTPIEA